MTFMQVIFLTINCLQFTEINTFQKPVNNELFWKILKFLDFTHFLF